MHCDEAQLRLVMAIEAVKEYLSNVTGISRRAGTTPVSLDVFNTIILGNTSRYLANVVNKNQQGCPEFVDVINRIVIDFNYLVASYKSYCGVPASLMGIKK